ncbi:MAG: magnesium transporter CorA family protein [Chloroflexi bacterium]|nr:magnesium transporter CorA family protein [Anaerolineaceae bacterium]NMD27065.1 magnesium transporter CorA family protein [Chloroflexota bacterium]HOG77894.1 magnesium transporter CorA family protein [Anaerolineaceae bacterium]
MNKPENRYFAITRSGTLHRSSGLTDALVFAGDEGYVWLDYIDPNADTLEELDSSLGIHPLSIEDCLNGDQLPKLDLFPTYSFMTFTAFEQSPEGLLAHELDVFISKRFLITASNRDAKGIPILSALEDSIARDMDAIRLGPSYLLHQVVDTIVDHKLMAVEEIEEKLDEDEDAILKDASSYNLGSLMDSRRDLQLIRKSLFHERELVGKLIRKDSPFLVEKSLIYFRDVYDHLSKYYEIAETAREQVTNLMEIHLSLISNKMAESSNRTNAIMRRLTLITTIFMPLTLISGIGGMSEFTMMVGTMNWRTAYLILLIVMIVIGVVNYMLLLRMERQAEREFNKSK